MEKLAYEILQFNINRMNALARIVVNIIILLMVLNLLSYAMNLDGPPYFWGYLVIYGALMLINLFYLAYFRQKKKNGNEKIAIYVTEVYISVTVILGAIITYYDVRFYGHTMMFMIFYFLCCMLFIVPTRRILPGLIIATWIVMMGLTQATRSPYIKTDHLIFIMSTAVIGLIIQITMNRMQKKSISQRIQLNLEVANSQDLAQQLRIANITLQKMALVDYLTCLPNRYAFREHIEKVFTNREQIPCSVFILDIDYFKQYNDYYGHLKGDEALQKVAIALEKSGYTNDFYLARWGGEEFLGFTLTAYKHPEELCQQLIATVETLQIEHKASPVHPYLTISIGIYSAVAQSSMVVTNQLYKGADLALYEAKKRGRNRYHVVCDE